MTQGVEMLPVEQAAWRCYHCGDVFTDDRCARLHFGRDEDSLPACQIKAGAEQGLLGALREAEYAAADAQQAIANECTDAAKAYYAQSTRHVQALRNAEELGYERGLADARAEVPHTHPAATGSVREALRKAKVEADEVYGIDWHRLEEISRFELALSFLTTHTTASIPDAAASLRRIYDALPRGPRCRDCGDEDGRCPSLNRPCDPTDWAIEIIQRAAPDAAAPTPDAAASHSEPWAGEGLGPLWRKVQQVQTNAMRDGWSFEAYRAGMAAALGIATHSPAPTEAGEVERLREALANLLAFFDDGPSSYGPWIIDSGFHGADDAVNAARAALTSTQGGAEE